MLTCFGPRGVLFLPQRPFFTDGSLREQVSPGPAGPSPAAGSYRASANLRVAGRPAGGRMRAAAPSLLPDFVPPPLCFGWAVSSPL